MSPTQIQKRKRALRIADALNSIEGIPVSAYAVESSEMWARGTISAAQMKELLIKAQKKVQ